MVGSGTRSNIAPSECCTVDGGPSRPQSVGSIHKRRASRVLVQAKKVANLMEQCCAQFFDEVLFVHCVALQVASEQDDVAGHL